jgi:glycosyltransferase involved in cell wall biosynthesis
MPTRLHIASLADPTNANGFYRGIGPMKRLEVRGHQVRQLSPDDMPSHFQALHHVDLLHVHRYADDHILRLAREAAARRIAFSWSDDDDMAAVPKNNAGYREAPRGGFDWHRRHQFVKKLLPMTQLVTAPSAELAQRFADAGAPHTAVIENHVPDEFCAARGRPHTGVVIGWIAGREHHVEIERVPILPVLQHLLDEDPRVRVITIGLRLGLRSDRYEHIRVAPFFELSEYAARFDVGIAPLTDIPFNRARSNIKLKEYASAGVPWLASPIGPYATLGEKQGGRLVPDDGWLEALRRLVDKDRDRRKLAKRAAKWASTETLSRNVHLWERHFGEAIERVRSA